MKLRRIEELKSIKEELHRLLLERVGIPKHKVWNKIADTTLKVVNDLLEIYGNGK